MFRRIALLVGSLLLITAVSLVFSTPSYADGESYSLNSSGSELTVSGGYVSQFKQGSPKEIKLSQSEQHTGRLVFKIESFPVNSGDCPTQTAWLEVVLDTSNKTVAGAFSGCGSYGAQESGSTYPGSGEWAVGMGYSQSSSNPNPTPPGTNSAEIYSFNDPEGNSITACEGIFEQFADDGCVGFSLSQTPNVSGPLSTVAEYFYAANVNSTFSNCSAALVIGIPENRVISGDEMTALINLSNTQSGTGCGNVRFKGMEGTLDNNKTIAIGGVGELDSFLGGEISADQTTTSSCAVDGIGWIICPVSNFMAGATDGLFNIVAELLLVQPLLVGSNADPAAQAASDNMQNAWGLMRNLANVLFVIVFLFIIFSQLTNFGVSNYGIKRMLPRLIVGAILVNISFVICALAVDLSNIAGTSLQSLLVNLRDQVVVSNNSAGANAGSWVGLSTVILSGGALAAAGTLTFLSSAATIPAAVGALLIALIPALLGILTAFLVLILRQALIIIFVIIAPLAFVAYLLPNTEGWYKKWQSTFLTLLIFFPLISLVFGGSQLAGTIIIASSSLDSMAGLFTYIGGLAVQFVPLFITPVLLKLSSGVLNRFAGVVNNPNKGPVDSARKALQERVDLSNKRGLSRGSLTNGSNRFKRGLNKLDSLTGGFARNRDTSKRNREADGKLYETTANANYEEYVADNSDRQDVFNQTQAQASRASQAQSEQKDAYFDNLKPGSDLLKTAAGVGGVAAQESILAKIEAEDLKEAMQPLLREMAQQRAIGSDMDAFLEDRALNGSSPAARSAAMNQIAILGRDKLLDKLGNNPNADQNMLQNAIQSNVGSLMAKAPDKIKGEGPAFTVMNGDKMAPLSDTTAERQIKYMREQHTTMNSQYQASIDLSLTQEQRKEANDNFEKARTNLSKATESFNQSVEDIKRDTTLQSKFAGETGQAYIKEVSKNSTAEETAFSAYAASNMTGLASIDTVSGKIR